MDFTLKKLKCSKETIKNELNIPVRYIGVGEGIADLQEFNPSEFAKALFEK